MAEKIIPDKLREIAKEYGCNLISYLTTTNDGDIFSLSSVNKDGVYLDIGLPIIYSVKGSIINRLSTDDAFDLISKIKD